MKLIAVFKWVRLRPRRQPLGSESLPASGNSLARKACEGAGAPLGPHACENRYEIS
jgi:hypothetical protein